MEAPLVVHDELSLADLQAMSAQSGQPPAHPVLGFYLGSVGYSLLSIKVAGAGGRGKACPHLAVRARLVAVNHRIAVASDLSAKPCRLRAVVGHYQGHAAAASSALHRLASDLPRDLVDDIDRYLQGRPVLPEAENSNLRAFVSSRLDHAVGAFTATLGRVHDEVDSRDDVRALSAPYSDTYTNPW